MAKQSKRILKYLDEFTWTLTTDGDDYGPGAPGCQGAGEEKEPTAQCATHLPGSGTEAA